MRISNIFRLVCVFSVCCVLTACGPSAEEMAKERARIDAEIQQLRDEIFNTHFELLKNKRNIVRNNEMIEFEEKELQKTLHSEGELPQFVKNMNKSSERSIAKRKEENSKAQNAIAELEPTFNRLVKKMKQEYGIEYKLTPDEEKQFRFDGLIQ